jgi:amino-acid N-acetyltransferase
MLAFRSATPDDVTAIFDLLTPHVRNNIILERPKDDILHHISTFTVAIDHDGVCGVVSFHDYGSRLKEVRSLAVDDQKKMHGIGKKLVAHLVQQLLTESPDAKIFTLTFVPEFFRRCGFYEVDRDTLPEKIWKDCINCHRRETCGETALVFGGTVA